MSSSTSSSDSMIYDTCRIESWPVNSIVRDNSWAQNYIERSSRDANSLYCKLSETDKKYVGIRLNILENFIHNIHEFGDAYLSKLITMFMAQMSTPLMTELNTGNKIAEYVENTLIDKNSAEWKSTKTLDRFDHIIVASAVIICIQRIIGFEHEIDDFDEIIDSIMDGSFLEDDDE